MLGNSKTGQVSGLLIRNWVPTFVDRFLSDNNEGSAGLEFGIKTLMRSNPNILRVVVNSGVSVKRIPRLCRNFSDFDVREVHLPRWFIQSADFLQFFRQYYFHCFSAKGQPQFPTLKKR